MLKDTLIIHGPEQSRYRSNSRMSVTIAALFAVGAFLSIGSDASAQSTLEELTDQGSATVALATYPPVMMLDADGSISGFGPDIDKAILAQMGIETVKGSLVEYSALIPSVQAGRATFASGGSLYITPTRCEAVLFSEPVTCLAEGFLVRSEYVDKIKTYKDIADQGLRLAVCGGCIYEGLARDAGVDQSNIVYWADKLSGMKMLEAGRVDVVALDMLGGLDAHNRSKHPELTAVVQAMDVPLSCTAAVFNKDQADIRDAYNAGLAKIIENGTYKSILASYGLGNLADVRSGTTAGYCAGK